MTPPGDHDATKVNPAEDLSLERLRDGIQGSISRHAQALTFSLRLIELRDQWSSLAADIKLQPNAAELKDGLERIESTFSGLTQGWANVQLSLKRAIEAAAPRLRIALEGADKLGAAGWTLPMEMTAVDIQEIAALTPPELDAHFLDYYADRKDSDLTDLERNLLEIKQIETFRTVLTQCFSAYRRGDFAITIASLISLFEGAVRNLCPPEHFYNPKVYRLVEEQYGSVKKNSPDMVEVCIWMSVRSFVEWLYQQYGADQADASRPFRHGVLHGTQAPVNEKVEVLRLFHALSTVMKLFAPAKRP